MPSPDARFYYDQITSLEASGARLTPELFASICHVFRADGYREGVASALRDQPAQPAAQAQNSRGEWVPAIPEPWFLSFGRTRCDCGEQFRGRRRYREHYALAHIVGLDA